MNFDEIIAVSGLGGLYRMVANRSNGLIVEELASKKRRFASARKHQFTPLASIGIYTDDGDTMELKKVFRNMEDQYEESLAEFICTGDKKMENALWNIRKARETKSLFAKLNNNLLSSAIFSIQLSVISVDLYIHGICIWCQLLTW